MQQLDLFGEGPPSLGPARHPQFHRRPPPGLYLGTSSWSFPGWDGLVYNGHYSESELAREGLRSYAQIPLFRCVSLDRSYYRPPGLEEYRQLASQVPDDFRFVVKTPRDLLTMRPGRGVEWEPLAGEFLEPVREGLGEKIGVILIQYPPGSSLEAGSVRLFQDYLGNLFERLPRDVPFSLEVREAGVLDARLAEICHQHGVSWCASVHPQLPPVEKQLLIAPPPPGQPVMIRWNLRPSLDYNDARNQFHPFNSLQMPDPSRRERLARVIARALQADRKVYLTVNNKAEGSAPLTLASVLDELESLI